MRRTRDFGGDEPFQMSPGGPLLTNHLRDLDLELELLKRKRSIIEQEQAMLHRHTPKRQYNFEDGPQRQGHSNHNYSNQSIFNRLDGSSGSGYSRPQGIKKQAAAKHFQGPGQKGRFATQFKINPWQTSDPSNYDQPFSNRKTFQSAQPAPIPQIRPLMSIRPGIGQKFQRNPPPRKDFKPTKVTKPKYQQPQLQKKNTIEETKKLVTQSANMVKKVEPDNILRADKPPSIQVKGRMELALGTLMKELKSDHPTQPGEFDFFQTPFIQRVLKQTIRTRIRNVMLDHTVGHVADVIFRYRQKFPKQSDLDLVKIAQDAQTLSSKKAGVAQLIETDDPQEFYKKNMVKVLNAKLEEMFSNLEKLYLQPSKDLNELVDKMPEPKVVEEKTEANVSDESNPVVKERVTYENVIGECEHPKEFIEKLDKVKFYVEFMDELIEQRLPKILPKFKDILLSMVYTDKEFLRMNALLSSQVKKRLIKNLKKEILQPETIDLDENFTDDLSFTSPDQSLDLDVKEVVDTEKVSKEKVSEEKVSEEKVSEEKVSEEKVSKEKVSEEKVSGEKVTEDKVTEEKLSENESTAKPTASVTENVDEKKAILPDASTPVKATIAATPKTPLSDMYFAKLISRPSLPARAIIYDFLNQYKPSSIKKHKTISNLLIIGFTNKEALDKILEVNEITLGNATVSIKASEQVNKTPVSTPSKVETPKVIKAGTETSNVSQGTDLDSQINDLLSTIRKSEETTAQQEIEKQENNTDSNGVNKTNGNSETAKNTIEVEASDKMDTDNTENAVKALDADNNEAIVNTEDDKSTKQLETIAEVNDEAKPKTPEKVKDLKESGRNTPTRSSSRLANVTPSSIRTRRSSRMAQNN